MNIMQKPLLTYYLEQLPQAIEEDKQDLSGLDITQFDLLTNNNGHRALVTMLRYKINITTEQFDYLIHNIDLNYKDSINRNILTYLIRDIRHSPTEEQWIYLFENTNLKEEETSDLNLLEYATAVFSHSHEKLPGHCWNLLIESSTGNQVTKALYNNVSNMENLEILNPTQWRALLEKIEYSEWTDKKISMLTRLVFKGGTKYLQIGEENFSYLVNSTLCAKQKKTPRFESLLHEIVAMNGCFKTIWPYIKDKDFIISALASYNKTKDFIHHPIVEQYLISKNVGSYDKNCDKKPLINKI